VDVVDDQTTEARAKEKARVVGRRHETLRLARPVFRRRLHSQHPPLGLGHGCANALKQAEGNQLQNILRESAEKGAQGKD